MSRIFALVGPSGVGKDTLLARVAPGLPGLHVVRRVVTRAPEAGGEDHEAVTPAEFEDQRRAGRFALHWQAHGLHYGIPQAELTRAPVTVFNGSRKHLAAAAAAVPGLEVIHVTATRAALAARLAARGRETAADIAARLDRAAEPLPPGLCLHVIDNSGDLDTAAAALRALLQPVRA